MKLTDRLINGRLFFDGGTGTLLQGLGLAPGERPEEWCLTHPDIITRLHRQYLDAGADIIKTNTFGINSLKFDAPEKYITAAIDCAKRAVDSDGQYIAYDMGPTGKLLEPLGKLAFEKAVALFSENARLAEKNGADLILIETMNDSYETKSALLAVKESCTLPVFVTNVYDSRSKLMTGADASAMIALLTGLGADAIGINCSLGPYEMMPVIDEYIRYSSLPVIVNPNAGLPSVIDGKTVYGIDENEFADAMCKIAQKGVRVLGGCCGTTPDYIRALTARVKGLPPVQTVPEKRTVVSSYTHGTEFGKKPVLIGERINPTGKKKIKEALLAKEYDYIFSEGARQADRGAHMLDVNAGLPGIDEKSTLTELVKGLQSVVDLPLQIDSTDAVALEAAARIYNGKPLINSVNGRRESLDAVLPVVKKYGCAVIALTIGEDGIPSTALGRLEIARKIIEEAEEYGIDRQDIIVDPLALAVSSDAGSARTTLEAIGLIKRELGVCVSLGVSNISFGLPARDIINAEFFAEALQSGLDAAIMNPFSERMNDCYMAHCALHGFDDGCRAYIAYATGDSVSETADSDDSLSVCIYRGLSGAARARTAELVRSVNPLEIIDTEIIPALERIGEDFEKNRAFLPQLLASAAAATSAFEAIKSALPQKDGNGKRIVLATVRGDIHDIGKNIVRVLLENFGFEVIDLGHDVPPEVVADAAKGIKLVGLSALMTTTVGAMEETIALIRRLSPDTRVVVGGAVLTEQYAKLIGADFYASDAMGTVRIAQRLFGKD